jgi:ATP-binding cassette subfamily B protein
MKKRRSNLGRLLGYMKNHRGQVFWATLFSILNKIFDLAPPALIGAAVDIVVRREDSFIGALGFPDPWTQFLVLAGATIFIWVMESLFEFLLEIYWRNLAQSVQHDLRKDTYNHLQDLELAYFEDKSTGGLLSVVNDDINQLERFLDTGANDLIQVTVTVLLIGGMYVYLVPGLSWMAMLPMPLIIWGAVWFQKMLTSRYAKVREEVGNLNGQLQNNISGIATIKSSGTKEYESDRIQRLSENYRQANQRAIQFSSAFVPLIRILILAGFTAILVYGGYLTLEGQLEVGVYSLMIFMIQRLLWPLTELGKTFDLYQRGMASAGRVLDLLDIEEKAPDGDRPLDVDSLEGDIIIKDLSFQYRTGPVVLENLNLSIPPGSSLGIVGATGSGKTSLIKLIARLYQPTAGQILLDGVDLGEYRSQDLSRAMGFVSQDVFLFHGNVKENIAYGAGDVSDEEIIRAAKIAEAHDFILDLPEGYETIIGERGQKLSGGQRQRVSIARAVLRNPPLLLLDEATSAVDNETEAAIQRSLIELSKDRTTIMVAHRLSTIRHADQIIVLQGGKIIQRGSHEELLKQGGLYKALWIVQLGSDKVS